MGKILLSLLFLFAIGAVSPVSGAEPVKAGGQRITGTARDALGRPVSHAAINLQASDGHVVEHTTSNANGAFSFSGIAPGTYAVVADKTGFKPATAIVTVGTQPLAPVVLALESTGALNLAVVAKRLDIARSTLSPETGSSTYRFTQQDIKQLPRGENTPLNEVILQAPGMAQDSFGQLHVRGEHANLQYRINGVELPEGISGFGQAFSLALRQQPLAHHRGAAGAVWPAHRRHHRHPHQERHVCQRWHDRHVRRPARHWCNRASR